MRRSVRRNGGNMRIVDMKCNHIVNPLGHSLDKPRLSWITEAEGAAIQEACQIQVAQEEAFIHLLYDSGKRKDIDSIGFSLPMELKPRTRYYWKVHVWTDGGQITSPVAWLETAKMDEPWTGKWITPDWEDKSVHPLLRKSFTLNKEVLQARLYICGLGLYEAEMNGKRVGDEYFTPYCNSYNNWIQYQTFDVTGMANQGENVIGVMLGNGWYKGRFGFQNKKGGVYGDTFALLCELVIQYTDGSSETVGSDESWKAAPSYLLDSSIYDGEIQDANRYVKDWSDTSLDDHNWSKVRYIQMDYNLLEARRSVPVRIKEKLKPVKVIHTPKNEIVLDMGQKMVGWVRFQAAFPGTVFSLQRNPVSLLDGKADI